MPRTLRIDTETYPLRPGLGAPRLVCVQHAIDDDAAPGIDQEPEITLRDDFHMPWDDLGPDGLIEGQNLAFDLCVLTAHDIAYLQPVFRMLSERRGRDTMLREQLLSIYAGTFDRDRSTKGYFGLGAMAQRYCGATLDKGEESWRTRYALLDGTPVERWPVEARQYASDDIVYLRAVSRAQRQHEYVPPDEWLQVCAAFALRLAAVWGVRTDPRTLSSLEVGLVERQQVLEDMLIDAGFFRDGSVNKKAVQQAVEDACARLQKPVPKTAHATKPQTKTDAETLETLAAEGAVVGPALQALVEHGGNTKILSTYIRPMKGGTQHAMTSNPNALVASGRTSWSGGDMEQINPWWEADGEVRTKVTEPNGTNLQNFPRLDGIRDCVVPRDGHWWASVDYDALEVRTFAQVLLWVVGKSTLAEQFQADPMFDPHTYIASRLEGISYAEGLKRKETDKKFKKGPRQRAKAAVFGVPGGMGAKKFLLFSKTQYGIDMTLEEGTALREFYLDTFPEVRDYFDYLGWLTENGKPFRQLVSGRIRGGIGFTDGCNTGFQGLAADGAKRALYAVTQACYAEPSSPLFGSRVTAFVHDEICAEVPIVRAHEASMEIVRLMETEMQRVCPDIPIRASPALSSRWIKAAEAKYVGDGADRRLTAWDL